MKDRETDVNGGGGRESEGGMGLLTRCGCHGYRCGACASGLFHRMQRNNKAGRKRSGNLPKTPVRRWRRARGCCRGSNFSGGARSSGEKKQAAALARRARLEPHPSLQHPPSAAGGERTREPRMMLGGGHQPRAPSPLLLRMRMLLRRRRRRGRIMPLLPPTMMMLLRLPASRVRHSSRAASSTSLCFLPSPTRGVQRSSITGVARRFCPRANAACWRTSRENAR